MKHQRIGDATPSKNGAPGMLGSSISGLNENDQNVHLKAALGAPKAGGLRVLKDKLFGHLIGDPRVIIERRNGSAFVSVRPRPWGWSNVDREFLKPDSPGVERYAQSLMQRIHDAGKAKHLERERYLALRKAEREAVR